MNKNESVNKLKENYTLVRMPDFKILADLVLVAKGNRTMGQFAKDTNISQSTLSRIINSNIRRTINIKYIYRIYEAREDKSNVSLLNLLMDANGYDYKEDLKNEQNERFFASKQDKLIHKNMLKNSIIAKLVSSGVLINKVCNNDYFKEADLVLDVCSNVNVSESYCWIFFILTPNLKDNIELFLQKIMYCASEWFLVDAWTPQNLKNTKISYVIDDKSVFDKFNQKLNDAKLNNDMSTILIDKNTYQILEENLIDGNCVRLNEVSICKTLKCV